MEREKVMQLFRDIADGKDPYTTKDVGYAEFRRNYYGNLVKAIDAGDLAALTAFDMICKRESVDEVTELMNWFESWLKF